MHLVVYARKEIFKRVEQIQVRGRSPRLRPPHVLLLGAPGCDRFLGPGGEQGGGGEDRCAGGEGASRGGWQSNFLSSIEACASSTRISRRISRRREQRKRSWENRHARRAGGGQERGLEQD
eukprot:290334-Hanusia_phi.AAC.2